MLSWMRKSLSYGELPERRRYSKRPPKNVKVAVCSFAHRPRAEPYFHSSRTFCGPLIGVALSGRPTI
jgi:hypothetical protein